MIELRMRGFSAALVVPAVVAAWPLGFVLFEKYARGVTTFSPSLFALCAAVASLPWISRLLGRLTYRAAIDDIALHVGGDALPWNTITRVTRKSSWRRTVLVLDRSRTIRITLVTRDLFAGRLEPIDELERRLPR